MGFTLDCYGRVNFNDFFFLWIQKYKPKCQHHSSHSYGDCSEIFFRVFLNKYKLHNLIKIKICILTTTIKNTQIHKIYNCLLLGFLIKYLSIILVKE